MKKEKLIKLEIKARLSKILYGYIACIFISLLLIFAILMCAFSLIVGGGEAGMKEYLVVISICLVFITTILYTIYVTNWSRNGKEIFILHPDKLEHILKNKPFKTEKGAYNFSQIEFSAVKFYDEYEDIEPDLDKAEKNYTIRFFLDNGKNIIYSERKVRAEDIRQLRDEYIRINPLEEEL